MIRFIKVRWKNFFSTGNHFIEIPLDTQKMTLIVGINGSGKSQLLDAICFGLFNKPYRKVDKPSLVNSINNKNCVVEVEFEANGKSYRVVRGIKPAIFEIWQDGTLVEQTTMAKDYQEYLQDVVLRCGYKAFTQIVLLGSARYKPFMTLAAADRREVLDDLLDIQVFTTMNVLAKQQLLDAKAEISKVNIRIDSVHHQIQYVENQLQQLSDNRDEYRKQVEDEINTLSKDIGQIEEGLQNREALIAEMQKHIEGMDETKEELLEAVQQVAALGAHVDKINRQIHFFKDNDTCYVCKQSMSEEYKNKVVDKHKDELEIVQKEHEDQQRIYKEKSELFVRMSNLLTKINNYSSVNMSETARIEAMRENIQQQQLKIDGLASNVTIIESNLAALEENKEELQKLVVKKQELADERDILEMAIHVLKDGGIKTQIMKQYLPILNKAINHYLNSMGLMVDFHLDENFDEVIRSRYRDKFKYENFSEGEKARIDLSIMMTFRHIAKLRNSVHTNLLILDEVFNSSLDSTGVDELVILLKDLVKDCNIFVISHLESLKDRFDQTYKVKKVNNYSEYSI